MIKKWCPLRPLKLVIGKDSRCNEESINNAYYHEEEIAGFYDCELENCAWYDEKSQQCAIVSIASIARIMGNSTI